MIALKIATTGLDPSDEVIAISVWDELQGLIFNTYVQPVRHTTWETGFFNGITPEELRRNSQFAEPWTEVCPILQEFVNRSGGVILYNAEFVLGKLPGLKVPKYIDLQKVYNIINGELMVQDYVVSYRLCALKHMAKRFGIDIRNKDMGRPEQSSEVLMKCYQEARRLYRTPVDRAVVVA